MGDVEVFGTVRLLVVNKTVSYIERVAGLRENVAVFGGLLILL